MQSPLYLFSVAEYLELELEQSGDMWQIYMKILSIFNFSI
jgi:hypothetical protein